MKVQINKYYCNIINKDVILERYKIIRGAPFINDCILVNFDPDQQLFRLRNLHKPNQLNCFMNAIL